MQGLDDYIDKYHDELVEDWHLTDQSHSFIIFCYNKYKTMLDEAAS